MSRLRNFCFTQHNVDKLEELRGPDIGIPISYIVIGTEVCPTTKKAHLQGYCELEKQVSFSVISKMFGHVEARRGTAQEASDYCKKEGNFYEFGILSKQGNRTDLKDFAKAIIEKKPIEELVLEYPIMFIKYSKGIDTLMNLNMKSRTSKPEVSWIWGLAGVGKTRYAIERHTSRYIKDGTMWWNNYNQQEAIIIDDYDGKWPFRDLLRLLDRYEYQGQTKGGYVRINSPFIYITCEFSPQKYWYGNELEQVLRRIDKVLNLCSEVPCSEVVGNNMPQLEF